MSSTIDFTSEDGEFIRLMHGNRRKRAKMFLLDYAQKPKYEQLLEAIVKSIVDDEDDDKLWIYLGLGRYWSVY